MIAPFFHLEQIRKRINELKELRYTKIQPIDSFLSAVGGNDEVNPRLPNYDKMNQIKKGDYWSGRDAYIWLNQKIQLPREFIGKKVVGYFDFGKTGVGNNSSFESMIYLNGKPYQGVDTNHKEVFFDIDKLGESFELDFRLWSGLEGGGEAKLQYHQFREAFIAILDEASDDLFYLGKNIVDTIDVLDDNDVHKHQLQKIMIKTVQYLDYTNIRSPEFYRSVKSACDYLNSAVDLLMKTNEIQVICTGHTHIDVAWLWRLKHTREKVGRSFSTVLRLMDQFDEYHFLQTQAQLYEYVQQDFPEIYKKIKEKVKENKWEPSGSMWVEADCNLTSGESIVRQILFGKRFFEKEFGFKNTFLWLPDVFGYTWAMPQILKKSGIDTFITTKISWNEVNRMPHDTFKWRGIDGSEILTHFVTTPDVNGDTKFYTYNGNILPKIIKGVWDNYQNKDLNESLLVSYGYGDGGGGVNRDMLENRRCIDRLPSMPSTITGSVTDYLENLHNTIDDPSNNGFLHVWDSELYLEFHRGTYTSQAYNKKMNRKMEISYRQGEMLSVFNMLMNEDLTDNSYPSNELTEGWKILLRNQFHDIIPGSSIHEVYEDSKVEYEEASELVKHVDEVAIKSLLKYEDKTWSIFNSAGWQHKGMVNIHSNQVIDTSKQVFIDSEGRELAIQETKKGIFVLLNEIEPVSFESIQLHDKKINKDIPEVKRFDHSQLQVDTPYYNISWNDHGHLISIKDKVIDREVLTGNGNELQIFEDKPREYDAWELESTIDLKKEIIDQFEGAKLLSSGPIFSEIEFSWKYNKSKIKQIMKLYTYSKRIDFETEVEWMERDKVLKVAFPVDVRSTEARYDIQFGNVVRPTHRSTTWDMAKFEVVGHQWADLSEKGLGVSLLNDCKYGYDIKDNVMRLTLLKSASFPDPTADIGLHKFTYSLYVHDEIWYDSDLINEAWDLNVPLNIYDGLTKKKSSFMDIKSESICLDAIKKTEDSDDIVLRFHEMHGGKASLGLKFRFKVDSCYQCDLMEENKILITNEDEFKIEFKPYEIKTFIIVPKF